MMFHPEKDIPSSSGKVIVVTGANAGIGKQTSIELARHCPSQIWVGTRNVQTGNEAVAKIKTATAPGTIVKLLEMFVSSLDSVKAAAKEREPVGQGWKAGREIVGVDGERTRRAYPLKFGMW
ncbi:hypothetical protein DM02DRAFT_613976 [Periconia macrospinosa]|uniref:Ketoreductase (KR) domain-containing protein n=1 Tax=Periconia macrospinosa TaxID=97972 RepID=A0A2V1DUT0_9PLEO|nr:hypothetical protein DM02DRAFT_613976 [Periconia macrospinosa]